MKSAERVLHELAINEIRFQVNAGAPGRWWTRRQFETLIQYLRGDFSDGIIPKGGSGINVDGVSAAEIDHKVAREIFDLDQEAKEDLGWPSIFDSIKIIRYQTLNELHEVYHARVRAGQVRFVWPEKVVTE